MGVKSRKPRNNQNQLYLVATIVVGIIAFFCYLSLSQLPPEIPTIPTSTTHPVSPVQTSSPSESASDEYIHSNYQPAVMTYEQHIQAAIENEWRPVEPLDEMLELSLYFTSICVSDICTHSSNSLIFRCNR
jgi:hypothetical protein